MNVATRVLVRSAAVLSVVAGLIHAALGPSHWAEWWGYGAFFAVAAAAQLLYAPLLIAGPRPATLWIGVLGNLALIGLYAWTRVVAVPAGPDAGDVEHVGAVDLASKTVEFALVILLAVILRRATTRSPLSSV